MAAAEHLFFCGKHPVPEAYGSDLALGRVTQVGPGPQPPAHTFLLTEQTLVEWWQRKTEGWKPVREKRSEGAGSRLGEAGSSATPREPTGKKHISKGHQVHVHPSQKSTSVLHDSPVGHVQRVASDVRTASIRASISPLWNPGSRKAFKMYCFGNQRGDRVIFGLTWGQSMSQPVVEAGQGVCFAAASL